MNGSTTVALALGLMFVAPIASHATNTTMSGRPLPPRTSSLRPPTVRIPDPVAIPPRTTSLIPPRTSSIPPKQPPALPPSSSYRGARAPAAVTHGGGEGGNENPLNSRGGEDGPDGVR